MKKIRNALAILLACLLVMSVLAACTPQDGTTDDGGTDEPTIVNYKFQILYPNNSPAADVTLKLTQGGVALAQATTDFMGEATCEMEAGFYMVEIDADTIPKGYAFERTDVRTTDTTLEYTLSLTQECKHTYKNYVCTSCGMGKLCSSINPQKVYIGMPTSITLDKARVDDKDNVQNADELYYCTTQDDSVFYFSVTPYKPEHVGHYKVTVTGVPEGVTLFLGQYSSSEVYVSDKPKQSDTGNAPTLEFNMEKRYMLDSEGNWAYRNNWLFGIRVEGETDQYPITLQVTVEWERELVAGQDYSVTDRYIVEMEKDAKRASDVLGNTSGKRLVTIVTEYGLKDYGYGKYPVAKDIDVVLGDDGYYHIGTKDGAILTVIIKEPIQLFEGEHSFLTVNEASSIENLLVSKVISSMHYEVYYYSSMLAEYGELCNSDGVYPVNEQLYTFLKEWVNQRGNSQITGSLDEDHAFLLACAFYADK